MGIKISNVTKALTVPKVRETTVLHSLIVLQRVQPPWLHSFLSILFRGSLSIWLLAGSVLQRLSRILGSETASLSPEVEMCLVGSRNDSEVGAAGDAGLSRM